MEIVRTKNMYGSGTRPRFDDPDFDYLLFRQDWDGTESVYFNKDEINDVLKKIEEGEILIHRNYSLLFCKNLDLFDEIDGLIPCYTLLDAPKKLDESEE